MGSPELAPSARSWIAALCSAWLMLQVRFAAAVGPSTMASAEFPSPRSPCIERSGKMPACGPSRMPGGDRAIYPQDIRIASCVLWMMCKGDG